MSGERLLEFAGAVAAFGTVGFWVGAFLGQNIPELALLIWLISLVVALPLSYWLVYGRGR
ncbi:hypothetical protein [Haloarcula salinisoli]|uniref:Uncharacterized protein n=1 Tax=Haloarcula salinisoli TaxID=2487746 RepID=A0A8J7YIQ1_9EURY|nr:hypothetical protein [Halomicroarcula salinisoli]MBX0304263.1 hypothetical protein [Halomicroarcula salinisoli]